MTTAYFLGNKLLGISDRQFWWSDTEQSHLNYALICPSCGDVWGRIDQSADEWLPVRAGCRKHPWIEDVGGTFIRPWRRSFVELPPEVLQYELNLRLEQVHGNEQEANPR